MARLREIDKRDYPRLAEFLPRALADAHNTPRILAAFLKYSRVTPADAARALLDPTTPPIIEVRDLGPGPGGEIGSMGRFIPEARNSIAIAEDVAKRFEMDVGLAAAERTVEAVVLHEMVHWADLLDGQQSRAEVGRLFEIAAYGEPLGRWYPEPGHPTALAVADGSRLMFPVTGRIGYGSSPWGRSVRDSERSNHGVDIFNEVGATVHAVADGEVVGGDSYRRGEPHVSEVGTYGQMIDIDHGNGLVSRYSHLATVEVPPGPVRQGARVGTLGATGTEWGAWLAAGRPGGQPPATAATPHLHFELRRSSAPSFGPIDDTVDPAAYFDFLKPGEAGHDAVVTALTPGRSLESPVPPAPDLTATLEADLSEIPAGHRSAYPNLTFAPDDPRGLRNNNPGNIKKDETRWAGLRTPDLQLDTTFFQFVEMKWGIRAVAKILRSYETRHGIRTVLAMSNRWAPTDDGNEPDAYARNVLAGADGAIASVDGQISLSDPDVAFAVIRGIAFAENGPKARLISDDTVRLGISLASSS